MPDCTFSKDSAMMDITPVENMFILEYMRGAPGEYVKVYLCGLMQCYSPALSSHDIEKATGLCAEDIYDAFCYWQNLGLVRITNNDPLKVEYRNCKRIQLSAEPSLQPCRYTELIERLSAVMSGRVLSMNELRKVYDWAEVFGFEQDTIVLLADYCVNNRKKGAKVSINYMDTVAKAWADSGVNTVEQAMRQIEEYEELNSGAAKLLKRWRAGRRPTEDELKMYAVWTREWGFDDNAIFAAAAVTTGASRPSFDYLNAVLLSYKEEGITDEESIAEHRRDKDMRAEMARLTFKRAHIKRSPTFDERELIGSWVDEMNIPREMVLLAAEYSIGAAKPFLMIKKLIEEWHKAGVKTVKAARAHHEEAQSQQRPPVKTSHAKYNYPQRKYTAEELAHIAVSLADEETDEERI
ncbi:MAG: Replication initiation and membrane attachment [Firmicutes bacterium ADurb.Bin182]|nr:MAG: Replication initiation and membrane attachment [Firmicutes bacterium ADurb.Bin182]